MCCRGQGFKSTACQERYLITGTILFIAVFFRQAFGAGFEKPFWEGSDGGLDIVLGGDLDLAHSCDADSVQAANMAQLHPILHDLVNTTFFRMFRVAKTPKCSFWKAPEQEQSAQEPAKCEGGKNEGFAGLKFGGGGNKKSLFGAGKQMSMSPLEVPPHDTPCGIDAEGERAPPSMSPPGPPSGDIRLDRSKTLAEQVASQLRDNQTEESCEFEEDLPTYWVDMCDTDQGKSSDIEDINLIKNPERNTGYNGSHIWGAMYKENCFEVGSDLPRGRFGTVGSMCFEERVLYRLLSGWHATTEISICKNFYAPGTRLKGAWAPHVQRYMESLGKHPDRVKNLHFSFVVILRAIKKAAPFLQSYSFPDGEGQEVSKTRILMGRLLDSQLLSLCSPLFEAFDETRLFKDTVFGEERFAAEHRSRLKRQFKSTLKNITALVDCVQCQRCRLHAKVFSLGLGSALKILLTPHVLIPSTTSRDEVVALVNVLWKLSEAMEDAKELTKLYWKEHAQGVFAGRTAVDKHVPSSSPPLSAHSSSNAAQSKPATAAATAPAVGVERAEPTVTAINREALLDAAIGAVRKASASGVLTHAHELAVLKSLVVQKASAEVLLLAKHYAADRPELFAAVALEATQLVPSSSVTLTSASAVLGSPSAQPDAIVIGGGLSGMVAAVSLLDRGAKVVLVDKQPYLGGNSGKASSGINAALNTSVESLIKDTTKSAGVLAREQLISKLASESSEAVSWLRDRTGVDLSQRCQLGGHTAERTLRPSNAFVGAELTFAIGQILEKHAAERPGQLRILTKTRWQGLERASNGKEGWRVQVQATNGSMPKETLEAPSVVIASGGFGYDVEEVNSYLMKYRPDLKDFPTTLGPQTTGDGIKIAELLGAQLVDMDRVQLHPTGFVNPAKPTEHVKTLGAEVLRGSGGLLLTRNGTRFTDELGTRQAVVNSMLKIADATAHVYGLEGETRRHLTLVLNGKAAAKIDRHATLYSKKGLLKKVNGLDGLAAHLGLQRQQLQDTFQAYNEAAKKGKDEFGRTVFPAGHWPIEWNEEFYVGTVTPVIHYTMGGIAIDTDGKVLSKTNETIPGLYAVGEASGGVHGDNRLAGNSLLECTVFGRHIGLTLPMHESQKENRAPDVQQPNRAPDVQQPTEAHQKIPEVQQEEPPSSKAGSTRIISAEEMQESQKKGLQWVTLYGKVYDLTEYVDEHPGGPEAIKDVAGTDGTETFETVHNKELLESMGFEPLGEATS
jgi:flavocytochrome c